MSQNPEDERVYVKPHPAEEELMRADYLRSGAWIHYEPDPADWRE